MTDASSHPWAEFLRARMRVVQWLHDEMGDTDAKIAHTLSMDEIQVHLIRLTAEEKT